MEHSIGELGLSVGEPSLSFPSTGENTGEHIGEHTLGLPSMGEVITIGLMGMGTSSGAAGTGLMGGESGTSVCHTWEKQDMTTESAGREKESRVQ